MTYQKITIPLDHGNRNMKTAEEVFTSGLVESDLKPVLGEYLQYNGKYYSLTGERIPYMRDKTLDDRFFILTLFGIGKELENVHSHRRIPLSGRTSGGTAAETLWSPLRKVRSVFCKTGCTAVYF